MSWIILIRYYNLLLRCYYWLLVTSFLKLQLQNYKSVWSTLMYQTAALSKSVLFKHVILSISYIKNRQWPNVRPYFIVDLDHRTAVMQMKHSREQRQNRVHIREALLLSSDLLLWLGCSRCILYVAYKTNHVKVTWITRRLFNLRSRWERSLLYLI